ncbi:MAG TPA: NotI family restriction endonuclease [Lamprocystis sp. (in: g-proteobacteria)]|nr:NotI family restriction endonuclease [Lamprocystis sp. (in: g-proteobacteria)]
MAGTIWEFFGYRADDDSAAAQDARSRRHCPVIDQPCEKTFNDGVISGVCSLKPITTEPVICCPVRLYGNNYQFLREVALKAFGDDLEVIPGRTAVQWARAEAKPCVAAFGKRWGGELRLPTKLGRGGYFVDWVLARLTPGGDLAEFVAVEVQTIDTTGNYRNGFRALHNGEGVVKTSAGLNWENVSKRILPQLIYKGQVLQREDLCKKGIFFVCPIAVFEHIAQRLGGDRALIPYPLQPASITFMAYRHLPSEPPADGRLVPVQQVLERSTTVYKLQEAFNNVTLPEANVYRIAILRALGRT